MLRTLASCECTLRRLMQNLTRRWRYKKLFKLLRQHRTIASAAFAGSFAPILQFEKLEIHTVFLRFPNFILEQNLLSKPLAELCGVALIITECEPSEVVHIRRGATTERARPAVCGGARNAQFVATRTQRSGSRLRACQNTFLTNSKQTVSIGDGLLSPMFSRRSRRTRHPPCAEALP